MGADGFVLRKSFIFHTLGQFFKYTSMRISKLALAAAVLLLTLPLQAAKFIGIQVVDKDYLVLQFRDGEVRYRDTGRGRSAFLGHNLSGDLKVSRFFYCLSNNY